MFRDDICTWTQLKLYLFYALFYSWVKESSSYEMCNLAVHSLISIFLNPFIMCSH